jgi:hypothetical protein
MRSNRKFVLVAVALAFTVVSCTGRREASFPDGAGQNLIPMALLTSNPIEITTGEVGGGPRGVDPTLVPIASMKGPDEVRPMFKSLMIRAKANETYTVRIVLDPAEGLTAYRVALDRAELAPIDDALAESSNQGELIVPMFNFPIKGYGAVVRAKNDLGEETDNLRLDSVEWDRSTHVQVSSLVADRLGFQLSETENDNIFRKDLFAGLKVGLHTGAANSLGKTEVLRSDAPASLGFMFENLYAALPSNERVQAFVKVEEKNRKPVIRIYRVVDDVTKLSAVDQQLIGRRSNTAEPVLMPISEFEIVKSGKIVRKKNKEGVRLTDLELVETDISKARHLQINALSRHRKDIEMDKDTRRELHDKASLDGKITTKDEMRVALGIQLAGVEESPNAPLYTRVDGKVLGIFSIIDSTESTRRRLTSKDPGVLRCPNQVKVKFPDLKDCLIVRDFELTLDYVRVELAEDSNGQRLGDIKIQGGLTGRDTNVVQIKWSQAPREVGEAHDLRNVIELAKVRGQEFLMRRTLKDSPNGFDYSFPGAMAEVEISKFSFEKLGVRVLRVDPLAKVSGNTNIDRETLMFIPAVYVRREMTDTQGNPLSSPRYVPTSFDDKAENVVAILDWSNNRVPRVASPLTYYQFDSCFSQTGLNEITEVDHRLNDKEGVLSFTLSSTVVASSACIGVYMSDIEVRTHSNYTFDERISFKRYDKGDEAPRLVLPYIAQKALGFGLFTSRKSVPTAGGSTGTTKTEIPLTHLWDISGNKTITYILSGIPESGEEREAVIKITREVVNDWNQAFRKALAGTPAQRAGDVLVLKVEGVDITAEEAGKLGDLDKNHIYYVQKSNASGVLGIGGNSANPRSGRVENGSLYMYGGNIRSSIEWMRKMEMARKEYHAIVDTVEPLPAEDGAASVPGSVPGPDTGARLSSYARSSIPGNLSNDSVKTGEALVQALSSRRSALAGTSVSSAGAMDQRIALRKSLNPTDSMIYEVMKRSVETGAIRDRAQLEQLVIETQLSEMGRSMTAQEKSDLALETKRLKSISELKRRLQKSHICAIDHQDMGSNLRNVEGRSDLELSMESYRWVLAHEMGHNLGLRHNFYGSFDKVHWKYDGEGETSRDYSSVMDYLDRHDHYAGLGVQDVASLRAAYGEMLELHPAIVPQIASRGINEIPYADGSGKAKIVGGKYVSIEDYRKVMGLQNWYDLTSNQNLMRKLPLRQFMFCSDEEANYFPTCARYDEGTSPAEIVQNIADDYRSFYTLRNWAGDRLSFSHRNLGGYIASLVQRLLPARQFLEETFYIGSELAQAGVEPEEANKIVNWYAAGAAEALFLFHEIARTPDASSSMVGNQRFAKIRTEKGLVAVERKWLQSIGSEPSRLSVLGVEYDKAFAMLFLTQRQFGFPRYENTSMRLSFLDFERATGLGEQLPGGSFTLNLLQGIMEEQVTALVQVPKQGPMFLTQPGFSVHTTDLLRMFGITSAVINSDIQGMRASDNPASLFRVFAKVNPPAGVLSVTFPDAGMSEKRYWATDVAKNAQSIIQSIALFDKLLVVQPEVKKLVRQWVGALADVEIQAEPGPILTSAPKTKPQAPLSQAERLAKATEIAKQIDVILATLPEEVGPRTMEQAAELLVQLLQVGQQMQARAVTPQEIEANRQQLEGIILGSPVFGILVGALPAQELGLVNLNRIIPHGLIESSRGIRFKNIQTMNEALLAIHPDIQE